MNEKQIAFITCTNDELEYAECRYYLDRLHIPEGYSTDIISIQEAPSMAAGYNAAMKSSDAKYKVYLHQDVFVTNPNFITEILSVFARDDNIGLLGMVGNRRSWEDIKNLMTWDTGKVVDSSTVFPFQYPKKEDFFLEVQMVDGLLLVTQHDLPWREDIFDGWHFYDLAQCMEFKKAGYKVVVPWQEKAWCYHDTSYPRMDLYYDYYAEFLREYGGRADFPVKSRDMDRTVYDENRDVSRLQEDLREITENFFKMGDRTQLREFFEDPDLQGLQCLWEYELIVHIDQQEEKNQSFLRFWEPEMTLPQLLSKIRALKHVLKRIEYGAYADGEEREWILENYSKYAVTEVCSRYIKNR